MYKLIHVCVPAHTNTYKHTKKLPKTLSPTHTYAHTHTHTQNSHLKVLTFQLRCAHLSACRLRPHEAAGYRLQQEQAETRRSKQCICSTWRSILAYDHPPSRVITGSARIRLRQRTLGKQGLRQNSWLVEIVSLRSHSLRWTNGEYMHICQHAYIHTYSHTCMLTSDRQTNKSKKCTTKRWVADPKTRVYIGTCIGVQYTHQTCWRACVCTGCSGPPGIVLKRKFSVYLCGWHTYIYTYMNKDIHIYTYIHIYIYK